MKLLGHVLFLESFDLTAVLFDPSCIELCFVTVPSKVRFTLLKLSLPLEQLVLVHLMLSDLWRHVMFIRVSPYQLLFNHESFDRLEHLVVDFCPLVLFKILDQVADSSEHLHPLEGPVQLHAFLRPIEIVSLVVQLLDSLVSMLEFFQVLLVEVFLVVFCNCRQVLPELLHLIVALFFILLHQP